MLKLKLWRWQHSPSEKHDTNYNNSSATTAWRLSDQRFKNPNPSTRTGTDVGSVGTQNNVRNNNCYDSCVRLLVAYAYFKLTLTLQYLNSAWKTSTHISWSICLFQPIMASTKTSVGRRSFFGSPERRWIDGKILPHKIGTDSHITSLLLRSWDTHDLFGLSTSR